MIRITASKVICGHCDKVLKDVPEMLKGDPRVIVEEVIGLCPEVTYADKEKVFRKLAEKNASRAKKESGS